MRSPQYWYSTTLDPIRGGQRHRFIHGYYSKSAGEVVESIKTRIGKTDPDYFEPSRPILQDGMKRLPELEADQPLPPDRTRTRWKAVQKEVVYLDFRSELSAYDKFFFHNPYRRGGAALIAKKASIRRRSPHLSEAIRSGRRQGNYYGRNRIVRPAEDVSEEQLDAISGILGRKYESVRTIRHTYLDVEGSSVVLRAFGHRYSEAFAGSGEFAVVMLVIGVTEAPPRSLVLLDEPEVSLHPGAQRKLMEFLYDQAKAKNHQIVISTHAPEIIRSLPSAAIKVFQPSETDGKIELLAQASDPGEAFFRLGVRLPKDKTIFVEDRLAAAIVRRAIRPLGEATNATLDVAVIPGGAWRVSG